MEKVTAFLSGWAGAFCLQMVTVIQDRGLERFAEIPETTWLVAGFLGILAGLGLQKARNMPTK